MNPEYQEQARRLQELRRSVAAQNKQQSAVPLNPTSEIQSGESSSKIVDQNGLSAVNAVTRSNPGINEQPLKDPLIYPDIYAPSGFDMLSILIRVRTRPNPTIDIGNIDSGVSLVLCDSDLPDTPIVYCSEPFESLTGYCNAEILGRNCRFLQHPPPPASSHQPSGSTTQPAPPDQEVKDVNAAAKSELREKIAKGEETQVRLVNYKKNGQVFINLLTAIPISWDEEREKDRVRKRYIVGFQVDAERPF